MVEITDAMMAARLERARGYCLMLLKVGPNYEPPDTRPAAMAAIVREHGRRNMQLQAEGKMPIVGPISGAAPIVGLCILSVSEDEARELMAGDPALAAGIFTADFATWYGAPGDALPVA